MDSKPRQSNDHTTRTLILLLFASILGLTACVSGHRPGMSVQEQDLSLQQLAGTYANQGIREDQFEGPLFSTLIFADRSLDEQIDAIRITVNESLLRIEGLSDSEVIAEQRYQEGEGFEFDGNRIKLPSEWNCMDCEASGALHLALALRQRALYLSPQGDAILRSRNQGVGVILLLPIPLGISEGIDVVFPRL